MIIWEIIWEIISQQFEELFLKFISQICFTNHMNELWKIFLSHTCEIRNHFSLMRWEMKIHIFCESKMWDRSVKQKTSLLIILLVITVFRINKQYNYNIKKINLEMNNLIQVLSLQAMTWLKIKLTANDFISFSQKTMFLSIFINLKIVFLDILINKFMTYYNADVSKKNIIIFNLIKNIQDVDS